MNEKSKEKKKQGGSLKIRAKTLRGHFTTANQGIFRKNCFAFLSQACCKDHGKNGPKSLIHAPAVQTGICSVSAIEK